jgi:molybdopterin-dependent oxidoreductase alpha subunit
VAASTCSLRDVLETDLIVLWGANVANNQPVFTKYLYLAQKAGARIVVVNPYLEPGLERYWVPSNVESALFGTRLADLHVPVRPGGDVALANAVLRRLCGADAIDREFIAEHTTGWDELEAELASMHEPDLLDEAGVDVSVLEAFVGEITGARRIVHIWSMGITQHRDGVEGVRAIVNLGLARGDVGRDGSGLMPIRGHSGVQGGAEMGAYATALPGGLPVDGEHAAAIGRLWGFEIPSAPGLTAPEMVDAALARDLDVLFLDGSNLLEILPDPIGVADALDRVPLRVHQDIVVTSQMLIDGDDVILLPAATRYEQEGGGTSTTTERVIAFSPEIAEPPGEARSEWRTFAELARRVRPDLSHAFSWPTNAALRGEIASVVPSYAGIEGLESTGDAVQYGGRHLCAGGEFPLPGGRARFTVNRATPTPLAEGEFICSTRRGRQFNSMVLAETDPLNGAHRDDVLIDEHDARALGIAEGDRIKLTSTSGEYTGRAKLARLARRSVQVHWPEGNPLLAPGVLEPRSKVPDYNAIVRIERAPA